MRNLTLKFDKCPKEDIEISLSVEKGEEESPLGEIKPGEEKSFDIDGGEIKLFATLEDQKDCYPIPEGEGDIRLVCRFDEGEKCFSFEKEEVSQPVSAKKSIGKMALIFLAALVGGILLGYLVTNFILGGMSKKEKTFTASGMTITLNAGFEQKLDPSFDGYFTSKDVAVFVNKDSKDSFGAIILDLTAEQYAKALVLDREIQAEVKTENGLTSFTFSATAEDGKNFRYFAYIYSSEDAYWLVQFAVREEKAGKYADDIAKWAGSVKFN